MFFSSYSKCYCIHGAAPKGTMVKKIMGFRFKERYINYYVGMVFLDASSFIVALLIDRNFIETVLISAILISIDVIFSTLYIKKKIELIL